MMHDAPSPGDEPAPAPAHARTLHTSHLTATNARASLGPLLLHGSSKLSPESCPDAYSDIHTSIPTPHRQVPLALTRLPRRRAGTPAPHTSAQQQLTAGRCHTPAPAFLTLRHLVLTHETSLCSSQARFHLLGAHGAPDTAHLAPGAAPAHRSTGPEASARKNG